MLFFTCLFYNLIYLVSIHGSILGNKTYVYIKHTLCVVKFHWHVSEMAALTYG